MAEQPERGSGPERVEEDDYECSICFSLLLDPVVAPCGKLHERFPTLLSHDLLLSLVAG